MQLSKLWNKRLPDSAIDELTVQLEKIESDRGTVPPDDEQIGKDGYPVDSGSPNILWFGNLLGFMNWVNDHLVSRGVHGYRLLG